MKLTEIHLRPVTLSQPILPSLDTIRASSERILERWPDVIVEPKERDRDRIVAEMLRRVNENSWKNTKLSFVTSAARALFDKERCDRKELLSLREFYYEEILASSHSSFLGAMFSIYLGSFDPEAPHTQRLSQCLGLVKERLSQKWQSLLISFPEILNVSLAATSIAMRMVEMVNPWNELKNLGIRSPHAPGVMDYAHLQYVERVAPNLNDPVIMERFLLWLKPEGHEAKKTNSGMAVTALLRASNRGLSKNDQHRLYERLLMMYGDPAVNRGSPWIDVPEEEMRGLNTWLTGENINFFMDIVSRVETSHMWEPRRCFWLSLHDAGFIDAAWVAFSPEGSRLARESQSQGNSNRAINFGNQTARGTHINKSLLLLKIGNKIVVEGSHTYKVHIFDGNLQEAPQLYKKYYDCEAIRLSATQSRTHDVHGAWKDWVLNHL